MRHPALRFLIVLALGFVVAAAANAQGRIELTTAAQQEVTSVDDQGNEVVSLAPAGKVVPGTVVLYTITARNISDEAVNSVVVNDPIPEHMTYIEGSAGGADTEIVFSVDGGKTFAPASELRVPDAAGGSRAPAAEDYTHVRWTLLGELAPQASRSVEFRAKLD